ncbi:DNA pilot protein [Sigmofec virus UA08Rod_4043]|uniref:DNA pilot protein n=1 Tax=Sigmofec virus UA08Rod_4043 TaxID=2929393 RepID=A0A976N215_9VIRU|nr:DNA pilot protein [Sigmofec virus UA08Rod_4043]
MNLAPPYYSPPSDLQLEPTSQVVGSTPPSVKKTSMNPLIGAGIGAVGNLLGGLFGSSGQKDANRTNLQIARETNQANRDMLDAQNEYNLQMWNRTNAYNDPAEARKRLENAGLNPLFHDIDGSTAVGLQSAAANPAVTGAPMGNEGSGLAQGVINASTLTADAALKEAQARNLNADSAKKDLEAQRLELMNPIEFKKGNFELVSAGVDAEYARKMKEADLLVRQQQRKLMEIQGAQFSELINASIFNRTVRFDWEKNNESIKRHIEQQHADNESKQIANDLLVKMEQLAINRDLASSTIEYNGAQITLVKAQAENQEIKNKYADAQYQGEARQAIGFGNSALAQGQIDKELYNDKLTATASEYAYIKVSNINHLNNNQLRNMNEGIGLVTNALKAVGVIPQSIGIGPVKVGMNGYSPVQ